MFAERVANVTCRQILRIPTMWFTMLKALSCAVDGPEEHSSKLLSTPFVEDPGHRLKWTAHLEFTHNHEVGDLTWDKVRVCACTYIQCTVSSYVLP